MMITIKCDHNHIATRTLLFYQQANQSRLNLLCLSAQTWTNLAEMAIQRFSEESNRREENCIPQRRDRRNITQQKLCLPIFKAASDLPKLNGSGKKCLERSAPTFERWKVEPSFFFLPHNDVGDVFPSDKAESCLASMISCAPCAIIQVNIRLGCRPGRKTNSRLQRIVGMPVYHVANAIIQMCVFAGNSF